MNAWTALLRDDWIRFSLQILASVTVISVCAVLAGRLARSSPALRFTIAAFALGACLVVPALTLLMRSSGQGWVKLRVPVATEVKPTPVAPMDLTPELEAAPTGSYVIEQPVLPTPVPQTPSKPIDWRRTLLVVYGMGFGVGVASLGLGALSARRLRQAGNRPNAGQVEALISAGVDPSDPWPFATVRVVDEHRSPAVIGVLRPTLVLSGPLLDRLSTRELRQVIAHEGEHVKGRHGWLGLLQRLSSIVFWPHPLVHLVARDLSRSQEDLCDNAALDEGARTDYARILVDLAERPNRATAGLIHGMNGTRFPLESRIRGLLDPQRSTQNTMNRPTRSAVFGVTTTLAILLAGIQFGAAQDTIIVQGEPIDHAVAPATVQDYRVVQGYELKPAVAAKVQANAKLTKKQRAALAKAEKEADRAAAAHAKALARLNQLHSALTAHGKPLRVRPSGLHVLQPRIAVMPEGTTVIRGSKADRLHVSGSTTVTYDAASGKYLVKTGDGEVRVVEPAHTVQVPSGQGATAAPAAAAAGVNIAEPATAPTAQAGSLPGEAPKPGTWHADAAPAGWRQDDGLARAPIATAQGKPLTTFRAVKEGDLFVPVKATAKSPMIYTTKAGSKLSYRVVSIPLSKTAKKAISVLKNATVILYSDGTTEIRPAQAKKTVKTRAKKHS
jgi:hypothetical protein